MQRLSKSFDLGGRSPCSAAANPLKELERTAKLLQEKHEDQQTTLAINSDLLSVTLSRKAAPMAPSDRTAIVSSQERIKALAEIHQKLIFQNFSMNEQKLNCEALIESEDYRRRDDIADLENKNAVLTGMWNEKEKKIEHLQSGLRNKQKRTQGFAAVQEMHIVDPTQQTLVMHNELQINRLASNKLNKKMTQELLRREKLLKYNRQLKQRNEQLKTILKSIMSGNSGGNSGNLSDKCSGVDMEKIKAMLENDLSEPLENVADEIRKADTSMILPQKTVEAEVELSVASSIGLPLPAKNDLSRSHDKIKTLIPMLDFSKIRGRIDFKKKPEEKRVPICPPIQEKKPGPIALRYPLPKKATQVWCQ